MPDIHRLRKAIDILKKVAEENRQFDLNSWLTHERQEEAKDEWCGTTACACGYFALDKEFSDLGFKVGAAVLTGENLQKISDTCFGSIEELNEVVHNDGITLGASYIIYNNHLGFSAAAAFFDISYTTARMFFSPSTYLSREMSDPQAVIDRMETYILRAQRDENVS
jgi:hypothetical protein